MDEPKSARESATQQPETSGNQARGGPSARTVATSPEALHRVIAVAAYYRAERRNFEPGHELEDWLNAEAEILAEPESRPDRPLDLP